MADETPIAVVQAIRLAGSALQGPVTFDDFAAMVLAIRPSTAKNAKAPIRAHLHWEWLRAGLLFVDPRRKVIAPINLALHGVRFRHVLQPEEIAAGALYLQVAEWAWLPAAFPSEAVFASIQWLDEAGHELEAPLRLDHLPSESGRVQLTNTGHLLAPWLARHHAQAGDAVLITVDSFAPPRWRLAFERAADRDEAAITQRNAELMDELYDALEHASYEQVQLQEALLSAHTRLRDPQGYPGDPLLEVVARDGRMASDGMRLMYIDEGNWLMQVPGVEPTTGQLPAEESAAPAPLSSEAAQAVYRFKVAPYQRTTPWRQVAILGAQTLTDLNGFLVDAFKHDWDHMGGFWRLVRRGTTKQFRELELGTVEPFGGGDGADRRIADLGLDAGDTLKWVYDFGDHYEYRLRLEEVTPGAESVADEVFPRIVGQNKPRYLSCRQCEAEGRQTVATWICITCSNREGTEVMLCEACLDAEHEEHYADEWVY